MTKDDIIKTAFRVWGRELYRTTSLSDVAGELGVSKPALYRHFRDKNALLDAMYTAFFDECADFIRKGYEEAVAAENRKESSLIMIRTIAEYYMRRRPAFVFSFFMAYGVMSRNRLEDEFLRRGIDLRSLLDPERPAAASQVAAASRTAGRGASHPGAPSAVQNASRYPSKLQLMMTTLIFSVSGFHLQSYKPDEVPSDKLIADALDYIEDRMVKGLRLDARKVAALDYEGLETRAAGTGVNTEDDALLKAVAGAVAEAGPWNASMEMVARRSGLSKSGLYAHFKNRQDMLDKLFITEFSRIADFAKSQIETTEVPEEQLYLAIVSVGNYLRSRPEILVSINWIKNGRLDLGKEVSIRLYRIIGDFKLDVIRKQDQHMLVLIAQWMLFLIVNIFTWRLPEKAEILPAEISKEAREGKSVRAGTGNIKLWAKNIAEVPNESFRILFRFIALGLEGLTP